MNRERKRIRIFGDSILKGVVYDEREDRYIPLEPDSFEQLGSQIGIEFQTTTRFGCTVTKGMKLLQRAVTAGLQCDGVLLEYGCNECDFCWEEVAAHPDIMHLSKTPIQEFEQTLKRMVMYIKSAQSIPMLMTLPPIDAERYLNHICRNGLNRDNILHWLGDLHTIERYQELYSLRIARVALETHTQLIDVRSGFLSRRDCSSLICTDGIHPNAAGHALIMDLLADFHRSRISA